ncbi:MAG: hypothetical protein AB1642_04405 [Pseudomonadota bacterium]
MLSPVALATWIAFCVPQADPKLLHVLATVGSGGEAYLITEAGGQTRVPASLPEGIRWLGRDIPGERHIGLTQIPAATLRQIGIPQEVALPECANLAIGWQLWSDAHMAAQVKQKTPMKAISLAFARFHDRQEALETPYSQKAVDMVLNFRPVAPAPLGSPLYFEVAAAAANHHAMLLRLEFPGSQLGSAAALAQWSRTLLR